MWRSILERLFKHRSTSADGVVLTAVAWLLSDQAGAADWRARIAGVALIGGRAAWKLLSKDAGQKFVSVPPGGMVMDPTWKAPDTDSSTIRGKH